MSARDDVRRLLAEGRKQAEIAAILGISPGRVSQLAKEIRAESKGHDPPAQSVETKTAKPRGKPAPKGNQYAKGNRGGPGGPPGNTNAVTTGEYQSIWVDQLDDEEQELLGSISTDALAQCEEEIRLITIRERRMLQRIADLRGHQFTLVEQSGDDEEAVGENGMVEGELNPETGLIVKKRRRSFKRMSTLGQIQAIEEALTRVQARKAELLELAHKLRTSKTPENVDINTYLDALKGAAQDVWADEPAPEVEDNAQKEDGGSG